MFPLLFLSFRPDQRDQDQQSDADAQRHVRYIKNRKIISEDDKIKKIPDIVKRHAVDQIAQRTADHQHRRQPRPCLFLVRLP